MTALSSCGELVRRGDPARFRAALFAPPVGREGLFALYAFNLELARVAPMVSEPMLGEIRLQWWRDSLDMIFEGGRVRRHEVVEPLSAVVRAATLPRAPFDADVDPFGQTTLFALEISRGSGGWPPALSIPHAASIWRATIIRMISFVPSRIWCTRRSRTSFSIP